MKPLIPLILLLAGASAMTHFNFKGELTCTIRPYFRYKIIVWEVDSSIFTRDKAIGKSEQVQAFSSPHVYSATAQDDLDAGPTFEIWFKIFHECTDDQKTNELWVFIDNMPINNEVQNITRHIDITNGGYKSTTTIPPTHWNAFELF